MTAGFSLTHSATKKRLYLFPFTEYGCTRGGWKSTKYVEEAGKGLTVRCHCSHLFSDGPTGRFVEPKAPWARNRVSEVQSWQAELYIQTRHNRRRISAIFIYL